MVAVDRRLAYVFANTSLLIGIAFLVIFLKGLLYQWVQASAPGEGTTVPTSLILLLLFPPFIGCVCSILGFLIRKRPLLSIIIGVAGITLCIIAILFTWIQVSFINTCNIPLPGQCG